MSGDHQQKKLVSRRQFLAGAGAVLAAITVAACTPKTSTITTTTTTTATTPATPQIGGILKVINQPISAGIGWPADPSSDVADRVNQVCFETLLHGDEKGNLYPWLAESYKVADDKTSILFTLRQGVKFHDSSDFNAETAKWNLDNYIAANSGGMSSGAPPSGSVPPSGGTASGGAAPPEGATPPGAGAPGGASPPSSGGASAWASVDILDNYTIRVNFKPGSWVSNLPSSFGDATNAAYMVSKASFDKSGIDWMRSHPVGTGPFVFESFGIDSAFKATKNKNYWQPGKPYLDEVDFIFISDPTTAKMAFQAGEGGMATVTPGKQASDFAALGARIQVSITITDALIPDTANVDSPWSKKEVREAAEFSIDREGIATALGYGYLNACYQIPPRSSMAYNPNFTLARKYDTAKAKQLLTEAGYPNGFDTTIRVFPDPTLKDITAAVQANLAAVGIKATLEYPEMGSFIQYMFGGSWPTNSILFQPLPGVEATYVGGLEQIFNAVGKSWARPVELTQAYQTAISSLLDVQKVRAVTDMISENALLIPISESGAGVATQPYLVADVNNRGIETYWNFQDFWINSKLKNK